MNLDQKKKELIKEIKRTKEFIEFQNSKVNIERYKDLKSEIESLQKKRFELFSTNKPKKEKEYLALEIDKQYKSLSKIPEVKKLIKAEKEFHNFMFKLYKDINHSLDLELK